MEQEINVVLGIVLQKGHTKCEACGGEGEKVGGKGKGVK